ncbi:hypothetical protein PGTUg99_025925 [Puccinia graminis f. sp. tritici]|uniref:Uncharacterized protein n=1 Tax=Puccinia graminis f. sp. tritici TaxID=56615 RepID=A0A5B0Q4A9_PUCGR|nr:hypothetical protein PGTUg99_025925 [Puccinia graminis f. sp. tritici]
MDGQTKPKLLYVEDAELEAGFERRAGRGRAFIRYNYHLKPTTTTSSSFRSIIFFFLLRFNTSLVPSSSSSHERPASYSFRPFRELRHSQHALDLRFKIEAWHGLHTIIIINRT